MPLRPLPPPASEPSDSARHQSATLITLTEANRLQLYWLTTAYVLLLTIGGTCREFIISFKLVSASERSFSKYANFP